MTVSKTLKPPKRVGTRDVVLVVVTVMESMKKKRSLTLEGYGSFQEMEWFGHHQYVFKV